MQIWEDFRFHGWLHKKQGLLATERCPQSKRNLYLGGSRWRCASFPRRRQRGGPWFCGETAYGTNVGSYNDNTYKGAAFYMAVNYLSNLGVSVLLAP